MKEHSPKPSREEVLDAFAVEPVHDRITLERYLRDYPQYAAELVELSREVSRLVDEDGSPLTAHEEALIETAWQNHASFETQSVKDPLAGLSVPQLREYDQHRVKWTIQKFFGIKRYKKALLKEGE